MARTPKSLQLAAATLPAPVELPKPYAALCEPSAHAAVTTYRYSRIGEVGMLDAIVSDLKERCANVHAGDLKRAESMLTAQAHSLDAIFNRLAQRASQCDEMKQIDGFLRLALKAQSQCRTTIEALAEIKQPRSVAFVRQANIANGPQQVNYAPALAQAEECETPPIELLESRNGEWMDTRATGAAGRGHTAVEAVGKVNRATKRRGCGGG